MNTHFSESANGLTERRGRKRNREEDEGKVNGYEEQAELAKKARRGFNAHSSYTGLPDRRFKRMDPEEIKRHLKFYDTDPLVIIASQVNLDAALGGSVMILDDKDDGDLSKKSSFKLREWRAFVYSGFLEAAYRYGCALGFIPWTYVPHTLDKGEPRVLNLDEVEVFTYTNTLGEPMYAFFEKPGLEDALTSGTYFAGSFVGRPIKNVFVTTWSAPGSDCEIRSRVAAVMASSDYTASYQRAALRAVLKGADPEMVTETLPDKPEAHVTEHRTQMAGGGSGSAETAELRGKVTDALAMVMQAQNQLGPERFEAVYADLLAHFKITMGSAGQRVDLPTGRKLAKQVMPIGPKDLVQVKLLHQQLTFLLFGVPPSFIQTESARGRIAGGDDSNSANVFRNAQKQLKQRFVQIASQAFNSIHNPSKILHYLMSQSFTRHVDEQELEQVTNNAEIAIPGTPPEDYLEKIYAMGMLKYEAYRNYVSTMHAIPQSALNETPDLSLLDMITGGQESLKRMDMEQQTKLQKMQLKGKKEEMEMKMDGDEKKTQMQMEATEQNAQVQSSVEKVKQKSMDQRIHMEQLKQKGVAQKAKLGVGAQAKSKTKTKAKAKSRA